MSEIYVVTAKTVEEAMAEANRKYSAPGKEVSFTILEMPKKGFFGFGAKEAKVQVTVSEEENLTLDSIVAEVKGYKSKTAGGKYGDNNRAERAERAEKPEKQENVRGARAERISAEKVSTEKASAEKSSAEKAPAHNGAQQQKSTEKRENANPQRASGNRQENAERAQRTNPSQEKDKSKNPPAKQSEKPKAKETQKSAPVKNEAAETAKNAPVKKEQQKPTEQKKEIPARAEAKKAENSENGKKEPVEKSASANGAHTAVTRNAVVREVNILSEIPASDPNAAPFRTVPGWGKKQDAQPVEEAAKIVSPAKKPVPAADVSALTETENPSVETLLDEALSALPETAREPERKKAGVTAAEMAAAVEFVNTLLRDMQLNAECRPVPCPDGVEYEITGEANVYPAVEIVGEGTGILIGHHGDTLDAIQCLLNVAAISHTERADGADYVKISLDIENYRAKREETLRALARRMAARALKYKRNVFLEPMNAYERRIIHSELQSVENISTHSVGTDKNRKIVITYEGADRQPDRKNRRSGENSGTQRNRKPGAAGEKKERPRPQKAQKLPIEALPDFLAAAEEEPAEHLREN